MFASRSSSLIRTKITRISSCGTKPRFKDGGGGGPLLGCGARWCEAGEEEDDAALHGNGLIVCMHEVMGLAGHQTEAECEGGRARTLHG